MLVPEDSSRAGTEVLQGEKRLLKSSTLGTSPAHPHPGPARCSVTGGLQRTQWYRKVSHHCLSGESKAHSSLRACARVMSSIYNAHSLESHVAHSFLHSGPFRKASWVAPCPDQRFSRDSLLLYPDSLFFITLGTYCITLHRAHFPSFVPVATVSSAGTSAGCACPHYCIPGVWHSTRKWTLLFSR